MTPDTWSAVDDYVGSLFVPPDPGLDGAQRAATDAGLPPIAVSAAQGKFLHILARLHRTRNRERRNARFLERIEMVKPVVLGGFSAARAAQNNRCPFGDSK